MIYTIQNSILQMHDFIDSIDSLNPGISFIVYLAVIIFSCYMLHSIFIHRNFVEKTKAEKVIFIPALAVSIVFILNLILAADVYPNLSAEKMGRSFLEDLCAGRMEEIAEDRDRIFAPNYYDNFIVRWSQRSNDLADIEYAADDFAMVEYRYDYRNISDAPSCTVVLRASKILNIPTNVHQIELCDFDFEVHLIMVPIPSRFLGKYMRWRISGFSYKRSKPYTIEEWVDSMLLKKK